MWPNRRLTDLLGMPHPIVLAPMAGIGTVDLAAAVCAAGGLGSLSCATLAPAAAADAIHALRARTTAPFSVNFFCHAAATVDPGRERAWLDRLAGYRREFGVASAEPPARLDIPPFGEAHCAVIEATRPMVASFHFGLPAPPLLARVKAAGCIVMSSATTVEEAVWLEAQGADVVIAQGIEAGGHRGSFIASAALAQQPGTLALVPQVVDAVRMPVIAAGGIGDGRGIAAALALGASGVQLGTAYLRCPEAATPPLYRAALQGADAGMTCITNVFTGRPARVLVNRLVREAGPIADGLPGFPLPMGPLVPLRAQAESAGSVDFTPLWCGQGAVLARAMPAEELTRWLAQDALRCLGGLADRPAHRQGLGAH